MEKSSFISKNEDPLQAKFRKKLGLKMEKKTDDNGRGEEAEKMKSKLQNRYLFS